MWKMLRSFLILIPLFTAFELIGKGLVEGSAHNPSSHEWGILITASFVLSCILIAFIGVTSRPKDLVFTLADEVRDAEERMQAMLLNLNSMTCEAASLLETLREGKAVFIRTDRSAYVLPEYWEVEDTDECDRDALMQFVVNWQPDYDDDAEGWRRDLKRVLAAEKVKGLEEKAHA